MLKVRFARPRDTAPIVNLVRGSFDKQRRGTLIYGCRGAAAYLRNQIGLPRGLCDTVYVVGERSRAIVGVVELRRLKGGLFLNMIATAPGRRGRGIGSELLHGALALEKTAGRRRIDLDVFEDNERALAWYERLGFKRGFSSIWLSVPLPRTKGLPRGTIAGYGQAEECQRALGFSQFTLITPGGSYAIGRLGNAWFRTTQREILSDHDALACLGGVDGNRDLLAIIRGSADRRPARARIMCRSLRMSMDLELLMRKLAARERSA